MQIKTDASQLSDATRAVLALPGLFARARRSATSSLANEVRKRLRSHVETGGSGTWDRVHPLTAKYRKGRDTSSGTWRATRKKSGPFSWLGKFARYRVEEDGGATIHFGKSREGAKGSFDPFIISVVKRAEEGERTRVTDKMRRFFGTTRRGFKNPKIGTAFFPLAADTTELISPARPIFDPVTSALDGEIMPFFERKFWNALDRYKTE